MVSGNPLFRGGWNAKKFGATVIDDIWPEVIFFTLVATVVSLVSLKTSVDLGVSNQLIGVLGLVLGLVISFRTSSAYERYQEGRKLWTNIIVTSKNLSQMIWIHIPDERTFPEPSTQKMTPLEVAIEKRTMINIVQAFSVSVKHLLRGEQGVYYRDLYPLISFLPRYAHGHVGTIADSDEAHKLPLWHLRDGHDFLLDEPPVNADAGPSSHSNHRKFSTEKTVVPSVHSANSNASTAHGKSKKKVYDPEAVLPQIPSEYVLKPARNPPETSVYDYFPFLRFFRWVAHGFKKRVLSEATHKKRRKAYADVVESHIPLEISLVLSNYSGYLIRNNFVQPAIASGITNSIFQLQDTVSNLERICNTPLPFAYQVHLRMSLWIYLLLLPFQIYSSYEIITIPATAFASFLLLGFLEIGQEIENPFNYDLNDLDLDHFCLALQRDLHEITTFDHSRDPMDYIFTKLNKPLAPADHRHAEELSAMAEYAHDAHADMAPGHASLRKTLLSGWRTVEEITRKRS
jgi:predicted membrane chloride channel (bestrophin family)